MILPIWKECCRVLAPNGKLVINTPLMPVPKDFCNTHHNRHIFNINSDIEHSILDNVPDLYLLNLYIWNRTNPTNQVIFGSYPYPTNFYGQNAIEFINVFVKDGKPAKVSKKTKELSRLSKRQWLSYTKDIWDIPIPNKKDLAIGYHSAIMPEEIVRRCIRLYSFVNDIILDPFAGSGTTLKVAIEENRNFVGYEIMKEYKTIIDKKINSEHINMFSKIEQKNIKTKKTISEEKEEIIQTLKNPESL